MWGKSALLGNPLESGARSAYLRSVHASRMFPLFTLALVLAGCGGNSESGGGGEPGLIGRAWESTTHAVASAGRTVGKLNPLRPSPDRINQEREPNWDRLPFTMTLDPRPLRLGETRRLLVTLRLENKTRRLVQLEFPTTQRIEVLVKDKNGRQVEQWSEDQAFSNEPSLVAINPGERLEYTAQVATRDFVAGQEYVVEGFFPNYPKLHVTARIVPEK